MTLTPRAVSRASLLLWAAPLTVAMIAAGLTGLAYRLPPPSSSDLDQVLAGAQAVLAGRNPYAAGEKALFFYPPLYPLTAHLLLIPLTPFSAEVARMVWAGFSAALLVVAARRYQRGLPPALLSASFLNAIILGQWSPVLTAAAVVPALGLFWAAKPSIGAAMFAAFPSPRAGLAAGGLVAISLLVQPGWPLHWWEALHGARLAMPIARPGGVVLLLALLRWRRPEARLVAALGCIPQTIGLYDTLPLFLVPTRRLEGYLLAALSYLAAFAQGWWFPRLPGMTLEANLAQRWPIVLVCLYLPALILALRSAPSPRDSK